MQDIVNTIINTLSQFVVGIGEAFGSGFQHLFMVETSTGTFEGLNDLGSFVLVFFGISLGYGVIRWLTYLFRRQG